jgi:hypothetical protein
LRNLSTSSETKSTKVCRATVTGFGGTSATKYLPALTYRQQTLFNHLFVYFITIKQNSQFDELVLAT